MEGLFRYLVLRCFCLVSVRQNSGSNALPDGQSITTDRQLRENYEHLDGSSGGRCLNVFYFWRNNGVRQVVWDGMAWHGMSLRYFVQQRQPRLEKRRGEMIGDIWLFCLQWIFVDFTMFHD